MTTAPPPVRGAPATRRPPTRCSNTCCAWATTAWCSATGCPSGAGTARSSKRTSRCRTSRSTSSARPTRLLALAGEVEGRGRDEDALAYFRDERDFRNALLVEQPNGDFADTIVREFLFDAYSVLHLDALARCGHAQLAALAAKSLKEDTYHLRHSAEWMLRLGRRHRREPRAGAARARRPVAVHRRAVRRPTRSTRRWPRRDRGGSRRHPGRGGATWWQTWCSAPRWRCPPTRAMATRRPARAAHGAPGAHAGRHADRRALAPRRQLVNAVRPDCDARAARARHGDGPRGAGAQRGRTRNHPRRAGDRRPGEDHDHAHLFRVSRHAPHGGGHARRARGPRHPGRGVRDGVRARLDERLDSRRGKGEAAAVRHRAAGSGGRAGRTGHAPRRAEGGDLSLLRVHRHRAAGASSAPRRAKRSTSATPAGSRSTSSRRSRRSAPTSRAAPRSAPRSDPCPAARRSAAPDDTASARPPRPAGPPAHPETRTHRAPPWPRSRRRTPP